MGYSSDIESYDKREEKNNNDNDENDSISNNIDGNDIENDINIVFGFDKGVKIIENSLDILKKHNNKMRRA
ncbi:hypothetical protein AYI70_g5197 [Smittium culicis]|uniref:Uncharacterized protein n=1 Tax=Smittium culicis TaxID=133412 RepID=A0A1R1X867_9FUNG|nr:hypothetical protein AYI70_g10104 [Smittium culicis]OMJ18716.1 hypothetical protein AYI70_g5197 [Smittium culicis]